MRSLIAERSTGGGDSRGAAFTSLTAAANFSDCARSVASSLRSEESDFSSASIRLAAAGSGTAAGALLALDSTLATRAARSSMAAVLTGGGIGVAGTTAGQPRTQATAITSEAATAPETAAMTQDEIAAAVGSWDLRSGSASAPTCGVSAETSVASSSMVGGGRLARPASGD